MLGSSVARCSDRVSFTAGEQTEGSNRGGER